MRGSRIGRLLVLATCVFLGGAVRAEIQVVDGVRYECADGLCRRIDDDAGGHGGCVTLPGTPRIAQGYMNADEFLAFLRGEAAGDPTLPSSVALLVFALLAAGVALNLTPCVLPMIPVNLIVIGKSFRRGLLYGLGLAVAYGALGVAAAFGGLAFGTIQASPAFNGFVAFVFLLLGVALAGGGFVFDFSKGRSASVVAVLRRLGGFFPFFMGVLAAVLAGACVAPVLISTLVLTADLSAKGSRLAWALPFVLGVGMALPWPFLGAGLRVLPRPGAWMRWVNRGFAAVLFAFAAWYGWLVIAGDGKTGATDLTDFHGMESLPDPDGVVNVSLASPATLASLLSPSRSEKPVLVDCWATWCKNCAAMERGTLRDPRVVEELKKFRVIRLQTEDVDELRRRPGFETIRGLPAFVILPAKR